MKNIDQKLANIYTNFKINKFNYAQAIEQLQLLGINSDLAEKLVHHWNKNDNSTFKRI